MTCLNCGGNMVGDGYTSPIRCEGADAYGVEPDASPFECKDETQIAVVKPQPIRDIMELNALADQRRSVMVGNKIYPAAWLLNCSAIWVEKRCEKEGGEL